MASMVMSPLGAAPLRCDSTVWLKVTSMKATSSYTLFRLQSYTLFLKSFRLMLQR